MTLPEAFLDQMKELLGTEFPEYMDSLEEPPVSALRVNTHKIPVETFRSLGGYDLQEIPWTPKGFVYGTQPDQVVPSRHPYYYAGLYYLQEPSAMIPAAILPVKPGDWVLDLCAAPGGKATELGAKLQGEGLLVANDVSASRTVPLVKNLQLAGITQSVVTVHTPQELSERMGAVFDCVLVDAPCSGEGMFRRDSHMVKDWLARGPRYYEPLQKEILGHAYELLKPGGYLVYSTCTFSPMEDEGVVQWLLDEHPDMHLCPVKEAQGYCHGQPDRIPGGSPQLERCIRIFPHRAVGEGHFAALLQKDGDGSEHLSVKQDRKKKASAPTPEVTEFLEEIGDGWIGRGGVIQEHRDKVQMLNHQMLTLPPLRIVSQGILLGTLAKKRFEPAVQLALTLDEAQYPRVERLTAQDPRTVRYLKGETLVSDSDVKGWHLVSVDGYGLGWAKGNARGTLKNKYYPAWRMV